MEKKVTFARETSILFFILSCLGPGSGTVRKLLSILNNNNTYFINSCSFQLCLSLSKCLRPLLYNLRNIFVFLFLSISFLPQFWPYLAILSLILYNSMPILFSLMSPATKISSLYPILIGFLITQHSLSYRNGGTFWSINLGPNKKRSRLGSVGRALDWDAKGPVFKFR